MRAINLLPVAEYPVIHFVAFDVDAQKFASLSPYLSKINTAGDQAQLQEILKNIVEHGILAERLAE